VADLNQFKRSKERLTEILYLTVEKAADEQTDSFILLLEMSIKKLDNKIEEFINNNDLVPTKNYGTEIKGWFF